MKLSIIIPYYKTLELTKKLLNVLKPQLSDEVEVLIVNNSDSDNFDDYQTKTLYCESNGTASRPRNIGLDNAKGKYITFIDSDDLVSEDYIKKILHKINTSNFDYCFFSWKFLKSDEKIIIKDTPPQWNCCVWNCIYKREAIGDIRFNETMKIAEDYDFNSKVRKGKKENIEDILYFYNEGRVGSIMTGG
jgi:glycosyltransferase involved in cell wall biosynthesis